MSVPSLAVQVNGLNAVSADNCNTYQQTCNIASDLRAFIGVSGVQVYMRGQSSIADGYQGIFYWNTSGVSADDNGLTCVTPSGSGSGQWTRLPSLINTYTYQVVTTGFSTTIGNGISTLILNPAGTLATGTVIMPSAPIDGQIQYVTTTQIITALTVSANVGQTVKNVPTTLAAGSAFSMIYQLSTLTWFRR